MLQKLKTSGREEPSEAFKCWKELKFSTDPLVSPLPFKMVARACLSSQSSYASTERFFSDLGKFENNQAQSTLSDTLEMTEFVRIFVNNEVRGLSFPQ